MFSEERRGRGMLGRVGLCLVRGEGKKVRKITWSGNRGVCKGKETYVGDSWGLLSEERRGGRV